MMVKGFEQRVSLHMHLTSTPTTSLKFLQRTKEGPIIDSLFSYKPLSLSLSSSAHTRIITYTFTGPDVSQGP